MRPTREFNAVEGDLSVDSQQAGPQTLARDIDTLMRMFNPDILHRNGDPGGIHLHNLTEIIRKRLELARAVYPSVYEPDDSVGEDGDLWIQFQD